MNIQKLYEASLKHKNKTIISLHYKLNKGIVNLFYPIFGKCNQGINPNSRVIISLTSYPARINTIYLTITTLLNQTVQPGKVMLWLAEEQFPKGEKDLPSKLLKLKEKGLTINFCDDLRSHKKYYYTMKENPGAYVITVDDDIFYPENLVELLMATSDKYPDTVVCTWGHEFVPDENGDVYSADKWKYSKDGTCPSFTLIPTGVGGVLYPPHCLSEKVFDKATINDCCLNADDLWLKAMALLNNKKAVRVNRPAKVYFSILKTQKTGLFYSNALENKNSVAWGKIVEKYPMIRKKLV